MLKPDAVGLEAAARTLAAGGLVAFPTETVYGLGADARNGEAIARLYAAKGRPAFNPLIAHVASASAARKLARFDAAAERLAAAFWPGPLTLVLPKAADCPVATLATAGLDSVAVRVPAHPIAQALLRAFGGPVVAPSANRSGHVSPTLAAHVVADLGGRIDLIVDGGATPVGLESTIIACLGEPLGESLVSRSRSARQRCSAPAVCRALQSKRCWEPRSPMPVRRVMKPCRARRACSPPIMRRARDCASKPAWSAGAKLCWHSVRRPRTAPRRR
jgi:tRNA threonylcarbamoyl adenosine modification protein (Sua5/YciO/YrdC/YwlC family)